MEELRKYRALIADSPADLFKAFAGAQLQRDAFLAGGDRPERTQIDVPTASEQMSSMLFGDFLSTRYKEYEKHMGNLADKDRKNRA
jgi:hypothetical protein